MITENETWIVDAGDAVIRKMVEVGIEALSDFERLVHCLWVADYGMRNAGDLSAAEDVYEPFQRELSQLADRLGLEATQAAFALPRSDLEACYLSRFEEFCNEIRAVGGAIQQDQQR